MRQHVPKPKSQGAGIMVSDFISEKNGYLMLTDEEYANPCLRQQAQEFLEYGKEHDGYWRAERFLSQLDVAATIAEIKYPKQDGYRIYSIILAVMEHMRQMHLMRPK